ncbi:MAG: HAD family hydrolase [Planctomycetaceae bacterium]
MPKSLTEYAEWLDGQDYTWPVPPPIEAVTATPFVKPLEGICAVTWSVYGTLLRISDGQLHLDHPQELRMRVAMEKTIKAFNMWQSMSRKPGAPWEYLYQQYRDCLKLRQMAATGKTGNFPQVNAATVWSTLLERLAQNEYEYDREFYGDEDQFAEKVAFFFHQGLQGVEASDGALETLSAIGQSPMRQTLLADAQPFTLVQLLRALGSQGTLPPLGELLDADAMTLSCQIGLRKPSPLLFRACLEQLGQDGIEPGEVLHIGSRLQNDLVVARQLGMKTALYAGDKESLEASKDEVRDPQLRPDRLLTELNQVLQVLGIE